MTTVVKRTELGAAPPANGARLKGTIGIGFAVAALAILVGPAGAMTMKTHVSSRKIPHEVSRDCMICHGMRGGSTTYGIIPRLAGQHASYLIGELTRFKAHMRRDQNGRIYMWPVAQGLTKAGIARVAAYFARQKPGMEASGVKHQGIAKGRDIFTNGIASEQLPACAECHGANGKGVGIFPRIAGQRYAYIVQQLMYFHKGTRKNALMTAIVKPLTKPQMKEVAAYLSSL